MEKVKNFKKNKYNHVDSKDVHEGPEDAGLMSGDNVGHCVWWNDSNLLIIH